LQDIFAGNFQPTIVDTKVHNDMFLARLNDQWRRALRRWREKGGGTVTPILQSRQAFFAHGLDDGLGGLGGNVESLSNSPPIDAQQVQRKTQNALNSALAQGT
jgi:hypothetical protein